ncbi:MAG: 2-C-methyl-D-erythritol 4-phosphate cytidylyltransferase [Burkholderiaceae bacterium]|jgi:2-C-methyl-D-erythritol 4-phosphate cytidylyltransferase
MLAALIPAAGTGSRAGGIVPKQYQLLGASPLVSYAIEAFASVPQVGAVYVVVARDDLSFESVPLSPLARTVTRALHVGGSSRHESVLNGLDAIESSMRPEDWVLVHDAARPGVSGPMIAELIRVLIDDPVGGLLALPVADTLKAERLESGEIRVARTVDRSGLWQAQTPQMFRYALLREALGTSLAQGRPVTDEAGAVENLGLAPRLVNGSQGNFKVTYSEDLQLAARLFGHS